MAAYLFELDANQVGGVCMQEETVMQDISVTIEYEPAQSFHVVFYSFGRCINL